MEPLRETEVEERQRRAGEKIIENSGRKQTAISNQREVVLEEEGVLLDPPPNISFNTAARNKPECQ